MPSPVHLQFHFTRGRHHLVLLKNQVFLAEDDAKFSCVRGNPVPAIVLDLADLWQKFELLAGDKIEFTKCELAKAGGVSPRMIRRWQNREYLPAHAGPFDAVECFTAALVGTLIRAGATSTAIVKSSRLVLSGQTSGSGVQR